MLPNEREEKMTKVSDAIKMLEDYSPDEEIALTGWWLRSDIENNNDVVLTDDQWDEIVAAHEDNTEVHIDEIVWEVLNND
jgi:hypothetical protein